MVGLLCFVFIVSSTVLLVRVGMSIFSILSLFYYLFSFFFYICQICLHLFIYLKVIILFLINMFIGTPWSIWWI